MSSEPSYTINQWCALRKYSRAHWYRMAALPHRINHGWAL